MVDEWNYLTAIDDVSRRRVEDDEESLIDARKAYRKFNNSDGTGLDSIKTDGNSLPSLSPGVSDKYFGQVARAKFFDRFHWLEHQNFITNTKSGQKLDDLYHENDFDDPLDTSFASRQTTNSLRKSVGIASPLRRNKPLPPISTSNSIRSMKSSSSAEFNDDSTIASQQSSYESLEHGTSSNPEHSQQREYQSDDEFMDDLTHHSDLVMSGVNYTVPTSPRTHYIASCIRDRLNPRASLILRKKATKHIKLQHMGIGDKMGKLLADSIAGLPEIESINIADNSFTDKSLGPMLEAIVGIQSLTEVDFSENIIGPTAAKAMGEYLRRPGCTLKYLTLHHADVDDIEADRFITALKANKSLTFLDMSHNFLGRAESLNSSKHDMVTAAESLAALLSSPKCIISTLKLGWNMIRFGGAVDLCQSIAVNKSLTYLDLSYNAISRNGGIALGEAILDNTTLKTIIVTSNAVDAIACLTICVGVMSNRTLTRVALDGNPIGEWTTKYRR